MTKITYTLFDGKVIEVEVPREVAEFTIELETEDRRAHWREKKRKDQSLDYLAEKGFQAIDKNSNTETDAIQQLQVEKIDNAIKQLSSKQQLVVWLFYFEDLSIVEIARILKVHRQSVYEQLKTIHKRLKKILK